MNYCTFFRIFLDSLQDSIQHTSEATRNLYIFLIYHMCKLDDM